LHTQLLADCSLILTMENAQKKILITDGVHPLLIEGLTEAGYICDYYPNISYAEVLNIIHHYTGAVINSKIIVNKKFLDKAQKLQFVGRLGSGLEIIDLDYAKQRGVAIYNSPQGNCDAVAEHAMGMLLMLSNHLRQADNEVKNKIWKREKNRGWELMGKTLAIIGFGHTGSALARRLQGWGMKVLAYDKYKTDYATAYPHVQETDMKTIFEQADILSFHLPLTDEVKHLATATYFHHFQKPIVILNTSRGAVIKTTDLIQLLQEKKVIGACLDVFENEKPSTYTTEEHIMYQTLFDFSNVIVSPHVAGWTAESKQKLAKIVLDKILAHEA